MGLNGADLLADETQPVSAFSMPEIETGLGRQSHGCALMPATSSQPLKVVCYGDYIGGEQTNFAHSRELRLMFRRLATLRV